MWFGTDGAGLMRFDGKKLDHLEDVQGRTNRHVNSIDFDDKGNVLFSTQYRGIFKLEYDQINRIDSIKVRGQNKKVLYFHDDFIVVQDGGIVIYKNQNQIVNEQKIYPYDANMDFYGSTIIDNAVFLFTSKGNFIVYDRQIIHLNEWLGTDEKTTRNFSSVYKTGDSLVLINKGITQEMTVLMDDFRPKFFIKDQIDKKILKPGEHIVKSSQRYDLCVFVTNRGRIVTKDKSTNEYNVLMNNSVNQIEHPTDIFIDRNRDIWVTTLSNGIFRVSLEPFTKLNLHPLYEDHFIRFIGRTSDFEVILSNSERNSYLGSKTSDFKEYKDLVINAMTEFEDYYLLQQRKVLKK